MFRYRLLAKRASKVFYDPIPSEISDPSGSRAVQVVAPHGTDFSNWTPSYPYYPPEAYPCFPHEEGSIQNHSFTEPTPEVLSVTPDVAPFQFSSSSLSAALTDIPQTPRPLPTIYEGEQSNSEPHPAHDDAYRGMTNQSSQDDFPIPFEHDENLSRIFLGVHFDEDGVFHYPEGDNGAHLPTDDMIPEIEGDPWEHFIPDLFASPASAQVPLQGLDISLDRSVPDNMSSTLSTPFHFSLSLSDPSTPNSCSSPVDLPTNFSINDQSNFAVVSPRRRSQRVRKRKGRKPENPDKPHRLSSSLPLTPE
ncbi:hypothetical protein D9615_005112 [Tricholomella constricta]|uniref:Uncharacterized protein n=1 Tax=Tricholomella constricta TaxID=117010 RepID=A0A8H5M1K9_9AGAR|nr:hypothetical protein D9615_005112 [Tricholomella constricta]